VKKCFQKFQYKFKNFHELYSYKYLYLYFIVLFIFCIYNSPGKVIEPDLLRNLLWLVVCRITLYLVLKRKEKGDSGFLIEISTVCFIVCARFFLVYSSWLFFFYIQIYTPIWRSSPPLKWIPLFMSVRKVCMVYPSLLDIKHEALKQHAGKACIVYPFLVTYHLEWCIKVNV